MGRIMTADEIACVLGGRKTGRGWTARCPAHDDHSPSLSISAGHDGRPLVKCHAGCDQRDVIDALRARGLWPESSNADGARPTPRRTSALPSNDDTYEREQSRKAAWLWQRRQPITGTIAETYLRQARGYSGPLPSTLAFLPPSKPEHAPAMIAAYGLPGEPEPGVLSPPRNVDAVHLTLLAPSGGKADVKPNKIIVSKPLNRPIVLAPVNDLCGLGICEGIEDALSIHAATGLGAWAAGAAGFMPLLADTVPTYVECVTIYAHDDPAGRRGATELAKKLIACGDIVEVRVEGLS
jgi:hypothetical protein